MPEENYYDKLRNSFRENAFHAFGLQYIFEKRIIWYDRYLTLLKTFGIVVPVLIGSMALGYGLSNNILIFIMPIAIAATIFQFVISVCTIVYKWDEKLSYSYEAFQSYNGLYRRFQRFADFPLPDIKELQTVYAELESELNARNQQNHKQNLAESELRRGMRYALRQFKRPCAGCKEIPVSMKSTKCPVCGNF